MTPTLVRLNNPEIEGGGILVQQLKRISHSSIRERINGDPIENMDSRWDFDRQMIAESNAYGRISRAVWDVKRSHAL